MSSRELLAADLAWEAGWTEWQPLSEFSLRLSVPTCIAYPHAFALLEQQDFDAREPESRSPKPEKNRSVQFVALTQELRKRRNLTTVAVVLLPAYFDCWALRLSSAMRKTG